MGIVYRLHPISFNYNSCHYSKTYQICSVPSSIKLLIYIILNRIHTEWRTLVAYKLKPILSRYLLTGQLGEISIGSRGAGES